MSDVAHEIIDVPKPEPTNQPANPPENPPETPPTESPSAGAPPPESPPSSPKWYDAIPDDFKIGDKPAKELDIVKNTPDVQTLVKQLVDSQSELGRRVRIPSKDSPDDVKAFLAKIGEAGIIESAPQDPNSYVFNQPESLPEGMEWNDDLVGKYREIAHSAGLTQAQAEKLVDFHTQVLGGMQTGRMAEMEQGEAQLKESWGDQYEAKKELAGRAGRAIFENDEAAMAFGEKTGLFNHPQFINIMASIGERIQEDQTILPSAFAPAMAEEEAWVMKTVNDAMGAKATEEGRLYAQGDPAIKKRVQDFFEKKFGTQPATQPVGQARELKP